MEIKDKLKEICERKTLTSFWEVLDYMLLANHEELDAIMMSLEMFEGDVWSKVISASLSVKNINQPISGSSLMISSLMISSSGGPISDMVDLYRPPLAYQDDLLVDIYVRTNESFEFYKPLYKSYVETRKINQIKKLEKHIKLVKINLTTEIGVKLFLSGYKTI